MSYETYEEHLRRGGVEVDPVRVRAFTTHCVSCDQCSSARYGYIRCPEGMRLAREASRPLDKR